MASGIGYQVGHHLQNVIDRLMYPEPKISKPKRAEECRFIDEIECVNCGIEVIPSEHSSDAKGSVSIEVIPPENSSDAKSSVAATDPDRLLKRIVMHKTCHAIHAKCMETWLISPANPTHGCLFCREPTWIPGLSKLPPPPAQPPAPPPPTMQERFVQLSKAGFTLGGQGLKWIGQDVLLALVVTAVLGAAAAGFATIVDPAPLSLLVRGPILGALAGTFFGSAITSTMMYGDSLIGNQVLHTQKNPSTPRWRPYAHGAITLILGGIALFTAYKVAFIAGSFLTTKWVASCVSFNQITSVLDMAWKLIPVSGSLQAGLSSTCAMTIAQVETFGIATFASGAVIWAKRMLWEKIPREWNTAHQYALRFADGLV